MLKQFKYELIAAFFGAAILGASPNANATIVTTGDISVTVGQEGGNSETKIYLDALSDTKKAIGHVGSQTSPSELTFTSSTNVDAKNGFASIDAIGTGNAVFKDLTITAPSGYYFTDLVFDTQKASQVSITGFDGTSIVGTYSNSAVKNGLDEFLAVTTNGKIFTSLEITSTDGFSEIKQFEISGFAAAVPEPATWAMMIAGFLGLGFVAYRRRADARSLKIA